MAAGCIVDTHLLYWWMTGNPTLGPATARRMQQEDVAVSVASVWEMLLKHRKGKLPLPDGSITADLAAQGFHLLPVLPAHLEHLRRLDAAHEDPFDRLLLATAIAEGRLLLTRDSALLRLGFSCIERA